MNEIIERIIMAMISAPQRNYTPSQLRDVVRSFGRGMDENQWRKILGTLKSDPRIHTKAVSKTKIYYYYAGLTERNDS